MPFKLSSSADKRIDQADFVLGLFPDPTNRSTLKGNCKIPIGDFVSLTELNGRGYTTKTYVDGLNTAVVHLTGDETSTGTKTFNGNIKYRNSAYAYSDVPDQRSSSELQFLDKNYANMGGVQLYKETNGTNKVQFNVRSTGDTWPTTTLGIGMDSSGSVYTYAPTPATNDNSTKIATTQYIRNLLNILYPIGAIYIGVTTTCPMAQIFGTWTKVSSGRVLQGSDASHTVGTNVEAGLPNITASGFMGESPNLTTFINQATGALYYSGTGKYGSKGGIDQDDTTGYFDASRSNNIYGKSTTVQPPAYIVNIWQRTA